MKRVHDQEDKMREFAADFEDACLFEKQTDGTWTGGEEERKKQLNVHQDDIVVVDRKGY